MLEAAEVGHVIAQGALRARGAGACAKRCSLAQFDLAQRAADRCVVIVSGVEGAGRHETANQLTAWMDPRHIRVCAFGDAHARRGGASDRLALLERAAGGAARSASSWARWYHEPLARRAAPATLGDHAYDDYLQRVRQHETMLCAEGVVLRQVLDAPVEVRR